MTRQRVLTRNQRLIESTEDRVTRDVVRTYEQARKELIARLLTAWTATEPSPGRAAAQLQTLGILGEVDARIAQLEADFGEVLRTAVLAQDEIALQQIRREIGALGQLANIDVPQLSSVEFALIETHLPALTDSLTLWSNSVRLQLRSELQSGLIQGESFDKLIKRLMAQDKSIWANGRNSAELMARRTVITANNGSKTAYIAQAQQAIPDIKRQVVAVIAGNTTRCCLAAHGQIRGVDEPFTLAERPRYADRMMYPAFHWRCRTSIAMYHPIFETAGGLTTESMRQAAQEEMSGR